MIGPVQIKKVIFLFSGTASAIGKRAGRADKR
jgi:hypothetical protein